MKFSYAACEACGRIVKDEAQVIAFVRTRDLTNKTIFTRSLKGQAPEAGVKCMCLKCVRILAWAADATCGAEVSA